MIQRTKSTARDGAAEIRYAWRRSYPGLVAVFVLSGCFNILKLAIPLYIFQMLDRVVGSRSVETLILLTIIVFSALIAATAVDIVRRRLLMRWGVWIEKGFGRKLLALGLSDQTGRSPTKSLRDLAIVRGFVSGGAILAWIDVIWSPLFLIIAFLIHPLIGMIPIVAVLLLLLLGIAQEFSTRGTRAEATRLTAGSGDSLTFAERNAAAVGALNLAERMSWRWHADAAERLDRNLETKTTNTIYARLMRFVESGARIAGYACGVWLVIAGTISIGAVIASVIIGRLAVTSFRQAMARWSNLVIARAAYRRLRNSFGRSKPAETLQHMSGGLQDLTITDLGHRYSDSPHLLFRRLDLVVQPGDVLAVIGPMASGKTTFTRLASGFMPPRTGTIHYGDLDLSAMPEPQKAELIGYLAHDLALFPGTIADNITGMREPDFFEDLTTAAKLIGIHDRISALPDGYETYLDPTTPALSTGELKCLALARTFYQSRPLIILDEPESTLDKSAREHLVNALQSLKQQGSIIILASQSADLVALADKVLNFGASKPRILTDPDEVRKLAAEPKRSRSRKVGRPQALLSENAE